MSSDKSTFPICLLEGGIYAVHGYMCSQFCIKGIIGLIELYLDALRPGLLDYQEVGTRHLKQVTDMWLE